MIDGKRSRKPMEQTSKSSTELTVLQPNFLELLHVDIIACWGRNLFKLVPKILVGYMERVRLWHFFKLILYQIFEFSFWTKLQKHSKDIGSAVSAWVLIPQCLLLYHFFSFFKLLWTFSNDFFPNFLLLVSSRI